MSNPSQEVAAARSRHLWELLPEESQKKCGYELPFALVEYSLLLNGVKGTIEPLKKLKLTKIEPTVGECNCHIRAYIFCKTAENCLQTFTENKTLEKVNTIFSRLPLFFSSHATLKDVLCQNSLDVLLTDEELFFIQCYLLTVVKKLVRPYPYIEEITQPAQLNDLVPITSIWQSFLERLATCTGRFDRNTFVQEFVQNTKLPADAHEFAKMFLLTVLTDKDSHKMLKLAPLSNKFRKDLVKKLRQLVSARSVEVVRALARQTGDERSIEITSQEHMHNELQCTPFFRSMKVIVDKTLLDRSPIIVMHRQFYDDGTPIRRHSLYFETQDGKFCHVEPKSSDRKKPMLFFEAISIQKKGVFSREITKRDLLRHNPEKLIAACLAAHKQLPNELASFSSSSPDLHLHYYREKAKEWGCSIERPDFFVAKHVFCGVPKKKKHLPYDHTSLEEHYRDFYKTHMVEFSSWPWGIDLVELAKLHDDPVTFLTDHHSFWTLQKDAIIEFLVSCEGAFEQPEVLDLMADYLLYREGYHHYILAAVKGIAKAALIPGLQNRALNLLVDLATYYSDEVTGANRDPIELRSGAREGLKQHIDNPSIKETFEQMLEDEPILQLRLDLMNIMQKIDHHKEAVKDLAFTDLISLIDSDTAEKSVKTVALRHIADYFFKGTEEWSVSQYGCSLVGYSYESYREQHDVRKNLILYLKHFDNPDQDVRREAENVFSDIQEHLEKLDQTRHPVDDVRCDIPRLLELMR